MKIALPNLLKIAIGAFLLLSVPFSPSQASERHVSEFKVFYDAFSAIRKGRETFRHDTVGDEVFWTDRLRLHQAIAGADLGGVGPGVDPATALAVGLKVDVAALPRKLKRALRSLAA